MKHLFTVCILILVYGCTSGPAYQKGLAAAENEDYSTAVALWTLLAEAGDARAQFRLGELYHEGLGVNSDIDMAMQWYRRAAEQGYADAQNNLGIIYDDGDEGTANFRTAMKWYLLAAEQGDPGAQFNLGSIYREEESVQDFTRAYMWWGISAYLGNDLAGSLLEFVERDMSPGQVAEARKLARRCVKQKYRGC
jgi:TPR repeat protein